MQYTQLSSEYKYDTIATAVYAREVEYFHFNFDRVNFEHLIACSTDQAFVDDLKNRLMETNKQMANVVGIIAAIKSQIDDETAYLKAVERVTAKREAAQ
jgi:hypothetical protein